MNTERAPKGCHPIRHYKALTVYEIEHGETVKKVGHNCHICGEMADGSAVWTFDEADPFGLYLCGRFGGHLVLFRE